jgi:hypothetical protein
VCGIAYPAIGLSIAVWKGIINLLTKLLPCFTEKWLHQDSLDIPGNQRLHRCKELTRHLI